MQGVVTRAMTKPHIPPRAVTLFLAMLLFAGMPGLVGCASTVHDLVDVDAREIERGTLVVDDGIISASMGQRSIKHVRDPRLETFRANLKQAEKLLEVTADP